MNRRVHVGFTTGTRFLVDLINRLQVRNATVFKRKWNEELIISHIMSRRGSEPLNALHYSSNYPDIYAAAQRIFGCWKYAIEACGIEYIKVRKYRQWTKTRVIEEIKLLAKKREPLNSISIQKNRKPLYMAALKRFKGWSAAMRAAGVDYTKVRLRRSLSKAQIKEEILKLWDGHFDIAYPNMRKKRQWLLANAMKKLGDGSWDKARKRCGIKLNFRLKGERRKQALAKLLGHAVETPKAKPSKTLKKSSVKTSKAISKKAVVKKAIVKKTVVKKAFGKLRKSVKPQLKSKALKPKLVKTAKAKISKKVVKKRSKK